MVASVQDACLEYAMVVGQDDARPWILTDYDIWVKNPYYDGPEVPHPESD